MTKEFVGENMTCQKCGRRATRLFQMTEGVVALCDICDEKTADALEKAAIKLDAHLMTVEVALNLKDYEGRPLLKMINYGAPTDGGRAFPCGYHPEGNSADQFGMTLRDYFAGQALGSYCAHCDLSTSIEGVATWAYRMADAMLKARQP